MLGYFNLVSTVDLSFMYCPFPEAFHTFSRITPANKEVQLLSQRKVVTLLSPGKSHKDESTDSNRQPSKTI